MLSEKEFRPGVYQHYKGGFYRALFLAKEEERSKEDLGPFFVVVYVSLAHGTIWTRPLNEDQRWYDPPRPPSAWTDLVTWTDPNGFQTKRYRFEYVGEEAPTQ